MRILEIILDTIDQTTEEELRSRNVNKAILGFLDDPECLEITVRMQGHGFTPVTFKKCDGPLAELAKAMKDQT